MSRTQKVWGYNYQIVAGRDNGTWHPRMGHGLLDAYSAILEAIDLCNSSTLFSNEYVNSDTLIGDCYVSVGGNSTNSPAKSKLLI